MTGTAPVERTTIVVRSELPAVVLEMRAAPGGRVRAGEELCLLESMKMEIPILAPISGDVSEVHVSVGQVVAMADPILAIRETGGL